ncbi:MAG: terminase family protein, partial [Hyphomicrobiaceae bacterium]|nr:terminase family protein [Hyphomicrobiaceae bacterium]
MDLAPVQDARLLVDATQRRRLDYLRFTDWQREYLSDDSPSALLRGGNQIGKTIAKHAEIIHRCRGTHPFKKTHRPPINALVLSESWEQMGQAGGYMEKLWELLPKDEIDPKIRFEPGRGITGKPPRVVFVAGPGKGSVISFGTYRQGASRVAGSTVHFVDLDEPGPESVLHEVMPRLLRHGGHIRIGFTPVLNMPDQSWLRKLVGAGEVREFNPWLKESNCWPRGNPAPWLGQADIDRVSRAWPEAIRA